MCFGLQKNGGERERDVGEWGPMGTYRPNDRLKFEKKEKCETELNWQSKTKREIEMGKKLGLTGKPGIDPIKKD